MSVIEAPSRVETTTIRIDENPEQVALGRMIDLVKDDRWCRDSTRSGHQHCALGLITVASPSSRFSYKLYDLLVAAIPPDDMAVIEGYERGKKVNGGTSRGLATPMSTIATYNNTIEGPDKIVDWFERARMLA